MHQLAKPRICPQWEEMNQSKKKRNQCSLLCLFMCVCGCVSAPVSALSLHHSLIEKKGKKVEEQALNNEVPGEIAMPDKLQFTVTPQALTNVY